MTTRKFIVPIVAFMVLFAVSCTTKEKLVEVTRVVEVTRIVEVAKPVERIVKETVVVERTITLERTVVVTATATPVPTPRPTATPEPTATPRPSIKVLSPNGGNGKALEMLVAGSLYPVTITSDDVHEINFSLYEGDARLGDLVGTRPTETEFLWEVGKYTDPNGIAKNAAAGGLYSIGLGIPVPTTKAGPQLVDKSDLPFTITVGVLAEVITSCTKAEPSWAMTILVPGNNHQVWRCMLGITNRTVGLKKLVLRQTESAKNLDIQSLRLYADGIQVGSTIQSFDQGGQIIFDLTAGAKRLETGNRVLEVRASITGDSGKSFAFPLAQVEDIVFIDTAYNVRLVPKEYEH